MTRVIPPDETDDPLPEMLTPTGEDPELGPGEEPWEWHDDGPEAHAMLEKIQDEEGSRADPS